MEKHDEAIETGKKALESDMKSSLCWNVLGMVYKVCVMQFLGKCAFISFLTANYVGICV